MTKILLTVVLTFLMLNLPRLILGVFEISRLAPAQTTLLTTLCTTVRFRLVIFCSLSNSYSTSEWQFVMDQTARYLVVLNSSVNFIIYCLAGAQFRSVLLSTLFSGQSRDVNI